MSDGSKTTAILHHGGLRSLVAAAIALERSAPSATVFIHVSDARLRAAPRVEHVRRQATHFEVTRTLQVLATYPKARLEAPVAYQPFAPQATAKADNSAPAPSNTATPDRGATPRSPMDRITVLTLGLAHAAGLDAERLIWPVQVDGRLDDIARVTEQVELASHLAQLEVARPPIIETPLIELTDRQVIELGEHLSVPWRLAFSCDHPGELHCTACPACIRRRRAFEAAGVVDPGLTAASAPASGAA